MVLYSHKFALSQSFHECSETILFLLPLGIVVLVIFLTAKALEKLAIPENKFR